MQFKLKFEADVTALTLADILVCCNFDVLKNAIRAYCTKEYNPREIKAGLKHALYYLVKNMVTICKGTYINDEDDKASEVDKFLEVFSMHQNILFEDATYNLNINRQINLQQPEQLHQKKIMPNFKHTQCHAWQIFWLISIECGRSMNTLKFAT